MQRYSFHHREENRATPKLPNIASRVEVLFRNALNAYLCDVFEDS